MEFKSHTDKSTGSRYLLEVFYWLTKSYLNDNNYMFCLILNYSNEEGTLPIMCYPWACAENIKFTTQFEATHQINPRWDSIPLSFVLKELYDK